MRSRSHYHFRQQVVALVRAWRFKEANLFGGLVKRIAVANVVVDQEIVTRIFPEGLGEVDVVAIYEVKNGKIANAWFKMGPPRVHAGVP